MLVTLYHVSSRLHSLIQPYLSNGQRKLCSASCNCNNSTLLSLNTQRILVSNHDTGVSDMDIL